jgi:putative endonuclease
MSTTRTTEDRAHDDAATGRDDATNDNGDATSDEPPAHSHFRHRLSHQRSRLFGLLRDAFDTFIDTPLTQAIRRRLARLTHAETEAAALAPHLDLGRRGELLAAERLRREGYLPVASNFELNVGRNRRGALVQAEIDLVAYEGRTLCFVEVKTRASDRFAAPEANVDLRKQRQIARAARAYRRLLGLSAAPYRYDVVSVLLPPPAPDGTAPPPRVRLLRNFFTDDKFRKRRWHDAPHDY